MRVKSLLGAGVGRPEGRGGRWAMVIWYCCTSLWNWVTQLIRSRLPTEIPDPPFNNALRGNFGAWILSPLLPGAGMTTLHVRMTRGGLGYTKLWKCGVFRSEGCTKDFRFSFLSLQNASQMSCSYLCVEMLSLALCKRWMGQYLVKKNRVNRVRLHCMARYAYFWFGAGSIKVVNFQMQPKCGQFRQKSQDPGRKVRIWHFRIKFRVLTKKKQTEWFARSCVPSSSNGIGDQPCWLLVGESGTTIPARQRR